MSLYSIVLAYLLLGFVYVYLKQFLRKKVRTKNLVHSDGYDFHYILWVVELYTDICVIFEDMAASKNRMFKVGDRVTYEDYDYTVSKHVQSPAIVIKNKANDKVMILSDKGGEIIYINERSLKFDHKKTTEDNLNDIINS